MKYFFYALGIISLTLLAMSGTIMSQVKEPSYKVMEKADNIEVREYAPVLVAEVTVKGERSDAISAGFRLLADFIFGNNAPNQKIAMTAPVIQQQGEKIAMTAPVIQQQTDAIDQWKVQFIMPAEYTLQTLPKPNNPQIRIFEAPAKQYAVIRFSGFGGTSSLQEHTEELMKFITARKLKTRGPPIYAFYNPPWTLPFFRRNEVMLELEK